MQQEKRETSSSSSFYAEEAGSSKQTDEPTWMKFSERWEKARGKAQSSISERQTSTVSMSKTGLLSEYPVSSAGLSSSSSSLSKSNLEERLEVDEKWPASDKTCFNPSPHIFYSPASGNIIPGLAVNPLYPIFDKVFQEYRGKSQLSDFGSSTSGYMSDSSDKGCEKLDKDNQSAIEEKFSVDVIDEKLSDQKPLSSPSKRKLSTAYGAKKRRKRPGLCLPDYSSTLLSLPQSRGETIEGQSSNPLRIDLSRRMLASWQGQFYDRQHREHDKLEDLQKYLCPSNLHAQGPRQDFIHDQSDYGHGTLQRQQSSGSPSVSSLLLPITLEARQEKRDQKQPTSEVQYYGPSIHTEHLPDSGNIFPGPSLEAVDTVTTAKMTYSFPSMARVPVTVFSSKPNIHPPTPVHASTSSYTGDLLGPGWEELDKENETSVEEKFTGGFIVEKLSDQSALSSPSNISSPSKPPKVYGAENKSWSGPDLPDYSPTPLSLPESKGKTLKDENSKLFRWRRRSKLCKGRRSGKLENLQKYPNLLNRHIQGPRQDFTHPHSDYGHGTLQRLQSSGSPSSSSPLLPITLEARQEKRDQKKPTSRVKICNQSTHTVHLPDSVNIFPGPSLEAVETVTTAKMTYSFPSMARVPVTVFSSKPNIHPPTPVHASTSSYTGDLLGPGWEELDKDTRMAIEDNFSGSDVESGHDAIGLSSNISFPFRLHGGLNKNWPDPNLPHSSPIPPLQKKGKTSDLTIVFKGYPSTWRWENPPTDPERKDSAAPVPVWPVDPPNNELPVKKLPFTPRYSLTCPFSSPKLEIISREADAPLAQSQSSSGSQHPSTNPSAGFNYGSSPAEKISLLHALRQGTHGEPSPAEHSLPANLKQTLDLFQEMKEILPHSGSLSSSPTDFLKLSPQSHSFLSSSQSSLSSSSDSTGPVLYRDDELSSVSSFDVNFSSKFKLCDSVPGPQDHSSDPQISSTVTEGSRAQAEQSSVHSEAESGGDVDAEVELEAAVTAVSCSVTNILSTQIQTCSSGPSWTEGLSGSLPRSHSCPSLSHMTSAENQTLTRAQSLPDLQLNSSCEQFTPDITADEDDETYRFQCSSPGLYQCSVTGLVFNMEEEGEVVYRTVPWNRKLLSQRHKQPAGPLFDIKCEQQSVCQLHLPHCEIRSSGGADFLSVAHFDEEGMEFIVPHKITETHVIINITGFSAFGNVKDEDSPPAPVRAMVLLFHRPPADPDPTSLLNLLLLPRNVSIPDVVRYRKKLIGDEHYIEKPSDCKLQPQQDYTLSTCPEDDSVLVEPTTAEFYSDHYDNYLPSFQVTLEKTMTHLKLVLKDSKSSNSVWERRVCLSSSGVQRSCRQSALNLPPNQRLFDIRSRFIKEVSGPVLKSLLDKLLQKMVMTDSEVESADQFKDRGDKARFVVDTVRRKGEAASSEMIEALCDLDPYYSEHLGLI
ncbi:uncharacterized protein LOC141807424 [Halichoeres trimaculatus]|uniref:uncharacterized protein LOC141807424 n=1 Tax=Halichoeres trimaculatus TaxID=147232 RepID=UPI003D9E1EE1